MVDAGHMRAIRAQGTLLDAIKLCIATSGLPAKTVYLSLEIDASHWARVMAGDAHFPLNKLPQLMDLCGNEIPLLWMADQRGYDVDSLRPKETELQRRLRAAEERMTLMESERQAERQMLQDLLSRRAAV